VIRLPDEAATTAAGAKLGALVYGGATIALIGDLGAGKTTLVKGLVSALGGAPASSPTFSLVNEYAGGRLIVWHIDLYRIEREAELDELGLEEIMGDNRGICIVEWADRFPRVLPKDYLRLELAHGKWGDYRELTVGGDSPSSELLSMRFLRELELEFPSGS